MSVQKAEVLHGHSLLPRGFADSIAGAVARLHLFEVGPGAGPAFGSTSARDFWRLPADHYLDPLGWYADHRDLALHAEQIPSLMYLVTLRARGLDAEGLLEGVYDPYVFYRDAYRQRRTTQREVA